MKILLVLLAFLVIAPATYAQGGVKSGQDPATVRDRSTYEKPTTPSEGIVYVLVNGTAVVSKGKLVDNATPGQAMRAPIMD